MKRDIRYVNSRGLGNHNSVEDWLGGSSFMQDPMDSDSNPNFPSSQDWDHFTPWGTSAPHYQVDPKRSPFLPEMPAPQRLGVHYMPYNNMFPRPEGPVPKPGVEPWHFVPGIMPTMTANSSSSGIYSSRNSDAFRPPSHAMPVHPFPRLQQHHLFAPVGGGGPIPSGGGPPSLLPPPFLFAHHPSSLPSQAYPPQERNSRAHSSASLFGTPNSNYPPTAPAVGVSHPDSANYAEQGCYSLPVTTAACSENQIQVSQMNRPKNQVALSKASAAPTNSDLSIAGKRVCQHRRTRSDPGLLNSTTFPLDFNASSSNAPPPPPPALRLDAWLKGCRFRDSSEGKLDEPSITSSVANDHHHWFHPPGEKKCQQSACDKADDDQTPRANVSGQSSIASDACGPGLQPLKLSNPQQTKATCCCNGWSVPMKLVEEVSALKESNRKLSRELRETRKELDDLKVMLPNTDSLKHDGSMSWQYPGVEYRPGMIAELVQELREASKLREEAFLSHIHSAVASQGTSCSCGQALLPDGGVNKRKMMCWWWGKSKWCQGKGQQSPAGTTCSPFSSSDVLQVDQDDQKKLSMRLRRIEEKLNSYKISGDSEFPRSSSLQETDFHITSTKGAKIPPTDDNIQRGNVGGSLKEESLNHDIALLKDDILRLRLQLQEVKATQQGPINQSNKIEQLTALLQKVACPSNGISLSGASSAMLTSLGNPTREGPRESVQDDVINLAIKGNSSSDNNSETCGSVSSGKAGGCKLDALNSSGESSCPKRPAADVSSSSESDSSNSSCGSNLGISSISSPVTMHGPVTDL